MKLQKQSTRKYKGKEYSKWVAVIPPKVVKEAGLKEGEELEIKVEDGKIILKPKK